jgi:hypothetical protein
MATLPGVIATYRRAADHYVLTSTNAMTAQERSWWAANAQGIIDGMAGASGPDVVGLLKDDVSYGSFGDHGGAQRDVQRVPMVFWSASGQARSVGTPFVLPDTMPTILKALGISQTYATDGKAWQIP